MTTATKKMINLKWLLLIVSTTNSLIYPCMTTVLNDSQRTILIINHNDQYNKDNSQSPNSIICIEKNASRRFGRSEEHAHFTVYTKQPKGQTFIATYEVQQNQCGNTGNPTLKLSDLKNNTGETNLFTITQMNTLHPSMVHQLPSMQRADIYKQEPSSCSACSGNAS